MITTNEELSARRKLVGYCERCEEWYKINEDKNCPECGHQPSSKIGFQLTTQRTFNPKAKKMTKSQIKKMGMGA